MFDALLILALGLGLLAVYVWAFSVLPEERWQILASIPMARMPDGSWRGVNLLHYGVWLANACVMALMVFLALMGALGVSAVSSLSMALPVLTVSVIAASVLARLIEKKRYTFTVGGAVFVGILFVPWVIKAFNGWAPSWGAQTIPEMPTLAALSIAFALGEGVGRLACISFGCCYGKPLRQCAPWVAALFARSSFVFRGKTKKAVYEGGLEGVPLFPVQAVTVVLYTVSALGGMVLFVHQAYGAAFVLNIVVTQGWRLLSETVRSDDRGAVVRGWTVYQRLAVIGALYSLTLALWLKGGRLESAPRLIQGFKCLWSPAIIVGLQAVWVVMFLRTGVSRVIGNSIMFNLRPRHERVADSSWKANENLTQRPYASNSPSLSCASINNESIPCNQGA